MKHPENRFTINWLSLTWWKNVILNVFRGCYLILIYFINNGNKKEKKLIGTKESRLYQICTKRDNLMPRDCHCLCSCPNNFLSLSNKKYFLVMIFLTSTSPGLSGDIQFMCLFSQNIFVCFANDFCTLANNKHRKMQLKNIENLTPSTWGENCLQIENVMHYLHSTSLLNISERH